MLDTSFVRALISQAWEAFSFCFVSGRVERVSWLVLK